MFFRITGINKTIIPKIGRKFLKLYPRDIRDSNDINWTKNIIEKQINKNIQTFLYRFERAKWIRAEYKETIKVIEAIIDKNANAIKPLLCMKISKSVKIKPWWVKIYGRNGSIGHENIENDIPVINIMKENILNRWCSCADLLTLSNTRETAKGIAKTIAIYFTANAKPSKKENKAMFIDIFLWTKLPTATVKTDKPNKILFGDKLSSKKNPAGNINKTAYNANVQINSCLRTNLEPTYIRIPFINKITAREIWIIFSVERFSGKKFKLIADK